VCKVDNYIVWRNTTASGTLRLKDESI